jgi:hypothetical protein
LSGRFRCSFDEAAQDVGLNLDIDLSDLYETVKIAELTGWQIEYINDLGWLHREAILQVYEAEGKLKAR